MNKSQRLEYLEELIAESPEDPFPHYCLCLEIDIGDVDKKRMAWEKMLSDFPDYLPSYYHAGISNYHSGEKSKAINVWNKGIEIAINQKDRHTLSELRSVLQNALVDED